jgi:uncharacterized protein YndB with AHSA1/START domain
MSNLTQTSDGRYQLTFERSLRHAPAKVWRVLTEPAELSRWYPFPVRTMELKPGGAISFDDEGSTYDGVITVLDPPREFAFREVNDLLHFALHPTPEGCRLVMTHTFDDASNADRTNQGWQECLDALEVLLAPEPSAEAG